MPAATRLRRRDGASPALKSPIINIDKLGLRLRREPYIAGQSLREQLECRPPERKPTIIHTDAASPPIDMTISSPAGQPATSFGSLSMATRNGYRTIHTPYYGRSKSRNDDFEFDLGLCLISLTRQRYGTGREFIFVAAAVSSYYMLEQVILSE